MNEHSIGSTIRRHYHWVVAAVAFLVYTVAVGLANNMYNIYLVPVTESLHISRGAFSIASSIKSLAATMSNLMFAVLFRRFGYRKGVTGCLILVGLAYLTYPFAQTVYPFYVGAVVVGLCESFCFTAGTSRILTGWFHRHQGLILGIVMASSGFGGSLFGMVMTGIMEHSSWRTAYAVSGGLLLATAVIAALLARDSPAKMGLRPLGEGEMEVPQRAARHAASGWAGFSFQALRRKPYFYLTILALFLTGVINYSLLPVITPHLRDSGFSATAAASVQSVMFFVMALAKILQGALLDRFNTRAVIFGCCILFVFCIPMLIFSTNLAVVIVAVALFSFPLAAPSTLMHPLTVELFGYRDSGPVLGILLATISLSGAVAAPAINFSHDLLGSYLPAFWVLLVLSFVALTLYLVVFHCVKRDRAKAEAQA